MQVFNAPEAIESNNSKSIFLAGSINKSHEVNWRDDVIAFFASTDFTFYNPARDDWDSSWKEEIADPIFSEQIHWELNAMERSSLIIMNFLPLSQSPITLLELGLFAQSGKLVVCCPGAFWKSGNVHIVCNKYNIPMYKTMQALIQNIHLQ